MRVYIAGPLSASTRDGHWENVYRAIDAAETLFKSGHAPFVPHLDVIWGERYEHSWEEWLSFDFCWLEVCDALLRLPGDSPGADAEVQFAIDHGIPVYHSVDEFLSSVRATG